MNDNRFAGSHKIPDSIQYRLVGQVALDKEEVRIEGYFLQLSRKVGCETAYVSKFTLPAKVLVAIEGI